MAQSDSDRLPDGMTRPRRVCFWMFAVSSAAAIYSFALHDNFQSVGYAIIAAGTLFCYALLVGMGFGYGDGYWYGHRDAARSATGLAEAEAERRRREEAPCEIVIDSDPAPSGEGFLYILKFSTGGVKVGQTQNLYRRICEHWRDASAYGVAITDYWVSRAHANYLDNEIELIGFCDGRATRAKREYFRGIEFNEVAQFAKTLVYYTSDQTATGVDR